MLSRYRTGLRRGRTPAAGTTPSSPDGPGPGPEGPGDGAEPGGQIPNPEDRR